MAAFDWYQATVREPLDDVIEACMGLSERATLAHSKGVQGYATRTLVQEEGETLAQVWHGGSHAYPHAVFTSDAAVPGAAMIRVRFPEHEVARLDAKEDFEEADAFDRMLPSLLAAAHKHRVKVDTRGDHLLRREARTVYLGAKTSAVQCRQYDKAAELRAKFMHDPATLVKIPENLTRLEVQVRPQTPAARQAFAQIEPLQAMGSSEWMRDIWRDIAGLELAPVRVTKPWRQSDDDRAYGYLLAAFGPLMRRRMADHGSWVAFGAQLGDDLDAHEKAARELALRGARKS